MNDTEITKALAIIQPSPPPIPRKTFEVVVAQIRRFYEAPDEILTLLGLFVMLTYIFAEFDAVPYLQVIGDPATGKTRLGEILELLTHKACLVARMSTAAVYRFVATTEGTLIMDEQGAVKREMREILNAGYKRSGRVMIVGKGGDLLELPCYGPKVIISNDPEINEALESRLLTIVSQPAAGRLDRFLIRAVEKMFEPVKKMLADFAQSYWKRAGAEYAALHDVDGLSDREFDLGAPLLAIANLIDESPGTPVRPTIEKLLIDIAAKRKTKRTTESQTALLARLVLEFASIPQHDARKNPPADGGVYLASELCVYVNASHLLDRPIRSAKLLSEMLNARGLIASRRIVDVDPDCAPHMTGRLRTETNVKKPRIQRTVYTFDLARARKLAGVVEHA